MGLLSQALLNGLNKGYAQIFSNGIANTANRNNGFLVPILCGSEDSSGFANVQYDYESGVLILTEVTDAGMQKAQNITTKQKTVDNKTFSRLIYLAREKLERGQARVYNRQFTQAGPAFALTKEKLLRTVLTGGFSGTNQIFFSAAQKKATGKTGTFTNAMDKKFSTANFDTALESLQSQTDTEDNPLSLGTDSANLHLVVGPKYRKAAAKCVGAKLVDGGDENVNSGVAQLRTWGQLTGAYADHWFLFDTSVDKPGVVQDEVPVSLYVQTNPQDSFVIQTGKFISQIYWRGNVDIIEPQWIYGSTGVNPA